MNSIQGAGVGLRTPHARQLLTSQLDVPWLEILADNWLAPGGLNRDLIMAISERYPTVLHGVGLSLGAIDPLDFEYLEKIKQLKLETNSQWYSEHCSFSVHESLYIPDLIPLPYTSEAVIHISQRIQQVQDFLGEHILLENVSSYLTYAENEMSEAEFLRAVAEDADCYLLLDLNNCYVSEFNNQESSQQFLQDIPVDRVKQIHLAGFEDKGNYLLDAHNNPVADGVWGLFKAYIEKYGSIPTLIEWDNNLPPLEVLLQEQKIAQGLLTQHEAISIKNAIV